MAESKQALRAAFKRIEQEVPPGAASTIRWLRHPASWWIRLPTGALLILGGVFSILPVLGLWMLPLGLMLIAADVPFLQKPMASFAVSVLDLWARLRTWWGRRR